MKSCITTKKLADVYFSFVLEDGTVRRVAAHKIILSAASDVFERMFYRESEEQSDVSMEQGDVRITDVSEAAFIEFVQFF